MYLFLFHGRKDPEEVMECLGEHGPLLGPIDSFHSIYFNEIVVEADGSVYEFKIVEDLIFYDGMYYGEFELIPANKLNTRNGMKPVQIDGEKLGE